MTNIELEDKDLKTILTWFDFGNSQKYSVVTEEDKRIKDKIQDHLNENSSFCPNCGNQFTDDEGVHAENGELVCSDDCCEEYGI